MRRTSTFAFVAFLFGASIMWFAQSMFPMPTSKLTYWSEIEVIECKIDGQSAEASAFLTSDGSIFLDYPTIERQWLIRIPELKAMYVYEKVKIYNNKGQSMVSHNPLIIRFPEDTKVEIDPKLSTNYEDDLMFLKHNAGSGHIVEIRIKF